jgi:hypothetical protein
MKDSIDKEIAERLASVYGRTGDSLTNEILRTGYYEACMFFLPKIREAVEALEYTRKCFDSVDGVMRDVTLIDITIASLRGVLTDNP